MRSIKKIRNVKGTTVLLRAALNVPIKDGKVAGTFRLYQALPTILYLQKKGAKVVLVGHLGDKGTETLRPVFEAMKAMVPVMDFCPVSVGKEAHEAVSRMKNGDVLMLENVRWMKGEKENDPHFASELASLADIFVQDSFDVCHRKHASVVGVPALLPAYAGFLVEEEVKQLKKALKPKRPALAVIAGAKFSTKEPVLHALLHHYSHLFVGGALANDLLKTQGFYMGESLVSGGDEVAMRELTENPHVLLPPDAIIAAPDAPSSEGEIVLVSRVQEHTAILDIGPGTIEYLKPYITKAKTVLWNGTLGKYENGFTDGTEALARALLASRAHVIVGGGDTVTALDELGLTKKFGFVSTGGGAMLDFLAQGTLPGLDALK